MNVINLRMDPISVLIIEDSENDYALICEQIRLGYDLRSVARVSTLKELEYHLTESSWDLIISNNALAHINAEVAIRATRKINKYIPFILVSDPVGEQCAVKFIKLGVNDYILKDNLLHLLPAIKREMIRAEEMRQQKETEEELSTFIYRSSHDLKGPISSMKGLVNVLEKVNDPGIIKDGISYLNSSIRSLDSALQHLLNVYKIKEVPPVFEDLNFSELVEEIIDRFKFMPGFSNVEFKLSIDKNIQFRCDTQLFNSILSNLIENAIKYQNTSIKSILNITIYQTDTNVNVVVGDNGQGIDKEMQDAVFGKFFRATEDANGTGLGLYVTKQGVEKMGGKIRLVSMKGKGSVFRITLAKTSENNGYINEIGNSLLQIA